MSELVALAVSDVDLAQELVERLNRLCEDHDARIALGRLIRHAVELPDDALTPHPTIQVWAAGERSDNPNSCAVGFLGMLNGIVGAIPTGKRAGWGYVAAVFEDNGGPLLRFELTGRG